MKKIDLPKPACRLGYTRQQVLEILSRNNRRPEEFWPWMNGQTMSICDGREYSHHTRLYHEACNGVRHGSIVYESDMERFLLRKPVID